MLQRIEHLNIMDKGMSAHVEFVGAGPGAVDLITIRGLRALEQADLVLYAGSLVNPDILKACKTNCTCLDSASMTLEEQIAAMSAAALSGKRVVRLHTGDPSLYGAINEQIRGLAEKGVTASVIPGVSSVFAAAAALRCELTMPGGSQSLVLTRTQGKTPMPTGEDDAAFARTGATLVFFLSAGKVAPLMHRLMEQGGLTESTPAALVYKASWPDERIITGTVGNLAQKTEAAGIRRQALILVGRALQPTSEASRLYDATFSHAYRNRLDAEAFSGRCALYAFTSKGIARARELAAGLGLPTEIRTPHSEHDDTLIHLPGKLFNTRLAEEWELFDAHIFICATGIAVRKIAPLLRDKTRDPAVLVCPENGNYVISLCSGHLGGANRLARRVARITGGQAVISTATDSSALPAFDEVAAIEKARILNTEAILPLNTALLSGKPVAFCGPQAIFERHFASTTQIHHIENPQKVTCGYAVLWNTPNTLPAGVHHLDIAGRAFILGIGCRRGVDSQHLLQVVEHFLAGFGLHPQNLAGAASCSLKADEPAISDLGSTWQIPVTFHDVDRLNTVPVPTPSETVRQKTGTASVCEAACLLSAGYGSLNPPKLYSPKKIFGDITLALARLPHLHSKTSKRGHIVVAGLGSGAPGQITPDVDKALRLCDTVAGYDRYIDLIRNRIPGKALIQTGMRGEMTRCRATLEAALIGRNVCMVCSGDPGILAMAGLLYELRAHEPRFRGIPIQVLPGITAANIAAAALGAPLQNGCALISLSDLLIPAEEVRTNLNAVARSMLAVALYNPAGHKRRELLTAALNIFYKQRGDVLCAMVKNAGRSQEHKWMGHLSELPLAEVDMSTLVIIGSSRSRIDAGILYEARGYRQKYPDIPE